MDTVAIRVPTKKIRGISAFVVSSVLRHGASAGCGISLLQMTDDRYTFNKNPVPFEDRLLSQHGQVLTLVISQFRSL
jgi:hypothetical protein